MGRDQRTDHLLRQGGEEGRVTQPTTPRMPAKSFPSFKHNTPPLKLPHQDNFSSKPPVEIAGLLTIVPLFESTLPFRPEPLSSFDYSQKWRSESCTPTPYDHPHLLLWPPLCASTHANLGSAQQLNPRSTAIRAVAKANNLDLEVEEIDTANASAEYLKLNPLSKVPTFVGADGYVLYECIAIAIYSTF